MKKLEVRFDQITHSRLDYAVTFYKCTKSDIARAAMILGLKALQEQAGSTGLSPDVWIAALNGKVK